MLVWLAVGVELTADQRAELRALTTSTEVSAAVGTRARIVLWHAEGRMKKDVAVLAGASRRRWICGWAADGPVGLLAAQPGGPRGRHSHLSLDPTANTWTVSDSMDC